MTQIFTATRDTGKHGRKTIRQFVVIGRNGKRTRAASMFYQVGPFLMPAPYLTTDFHTQAGRFTENSKYGYTQNE